MRFALSTLTAVAALAAHHDPGQALAVQPHVGYGGRLVRPHGGTEPDRDVLEPVDEAVEGEHLGGELLVAHLQRQLHATADGGG